MVKMTVLSSGSKGNSAVISSSRTRILVDAGLSCREILKRMSTAGEDPRTLDAIVITHEHDDHVRGVAVMARRLGIPVFFTEPTHRAWVRAMHPKKRVTYKDWLESRRAAASDSPAEADEAASGEKKTKPEEDICALPKVEYFSAGVDFPIGDIIVSPFTIPHDAADPVGFVFGVDGARVAVVTDLGYMPANVKCQLSRCDILMLESNHDLDMLRDGPYPWAVKQRVLSRVGHLSNLAAAEFLEGEYDGGAAYVVLAHLSENNNLPELARISAEHALGGRMNLLGNHLLLAMQDRPLESIVL